MADVLERVPVFVNGREIAPEAIAAEAQHHPAPDADAAWQAAAEALVVRQLLLDEAERLAIDGASLTDAEGRPLAAEEALIEALLADQVKTPKADEAVTRRFYDANQFRFMSAPMVEAAHILFAATPEDDLAYGLATGDARMAIRRLQNDPSAFAEIARERSACPSKEQGGNLGQVGPGDMVAEFEQALFALEAGALCLEPVKTRFGVHVVRAGRREEPQLLPYELVSAKIADYLEEASWRRAVAQYLSILASNASLEGVEIAGPEGPLVQ
jgi:peptidyl-prolyl cis-trans isomerase C